MNSSRITEIISEKLPIKPALVSFQNGMLTPECVNKLACTYYKKDGDLMAAIASDSSIFTGKVQRDSMYNHFLLIRNKKKETCKLVEVDQVLITTEVKQKDSSENVAASVADLTKQFGFKKQKRLTIQREKLQSNVEAIKENLEKVADETKINEADVSLSNQTNTDGLYKPPINRDAERVEDIYPVDSLVASNILSNLNEMVETLLSTDDESTVLTSEYVKGAYLRLRHSSMSSATNPLKIQLLLYLDCLINFIHQPAKMIGQKKYQPATYSTELSNYIFSNFSVLTATGVRTRPMAMRDKCICYILVISTIANNYQINIDLLSKELKLSMKKVQDLCRAMSFTVNTKDSMAILKLPLPKPFVSTGMKRKR